jgi:hypothetical protein
MINIQPTHTHTQQVVTYKEKSTAELDALMVQLKDAKTGVHVGKHRHRLKSYKNTFVGSEFVDAVVRFVVKKDDDDAPLSRAEAVAIGNQLLDRGHFSHRFGDHRLKDANLFYTFSEESSGSGSAVVVDGDIAADGHLHAASRESESLLQLMYRMLECTSLCPWYKSVGGATALMTFICVLCTLRSKISRSICNFTHYSNHTKHEILTIYTQLHTLQVETHPEDVRALFPVLFMYARSKGFFPRLIDFMTPTLEQRPQLRLVVKGFMQAMGDAFTRTFRLVELQDEESATLALATGGDSIAAQIGGEIGRK